ncbi:MAG: patatin-like phospholipase family protein [Bacteroidales bacterium]|nr:patatin-like phospholipase family protein [Bacteroidales bacterium]
MEIKGRNIALVLSGGGARGLAHIGVIEEIEKAGGRITSLAGTSIGSVVAGVYAAGKLEEYREWVCSLSRMDMIRLVDLAISKNGFIRGEKVFREIKRFTGAVKIEELPVPYAAVAADIDRHEEVVFREGPLLEALRASVSIPTVFRPFRYKKQNLVDGSVLDPLPMDCVARHDGDLLVAVDLNADIPYKPPPAFEMEEKSDSAYRKALETINEKWTQYFHSSRKKEKAPGFFDLMMKSIYAMQVRLTRIALEQYRPDLLIEISRHSCDVFEFHRAEEMVEYGRISFRRCVAK